MTLNEITTALLSLMFLWAKPWKYPFWCVKLFFSPTVSTGKKIPLTQTNKLLFYFGPLWTLEMKKTAAQKTDCQTLKGTTWPSVLSITCEKNISFQSTAWLLHLCFPPEQVLSRPLSHLFQIDLHPTKCPLSLNYSWLSVRAFFSPIHMTYLSSPSNYALVHDSSLR